MRLKHGTAYDARRARWYRGANITMRVIRRFARRVADRFQPDKIILFGSYAYGTPHAASDVDLLVIMAARNPIDQAFKIRCEVPTQFPMDLLVLKPQNVEWRLKERDSFPTEIMTRGKILYEKDRARVDTQSRRRLSCSGDTRRGRPAVS
jgi:predicted nucleotidyltransferase